jgi:hypothetical protein
MSGMPSHDLVVLESFGSQMYAELAKTALASAGIESMIESDSAGGMRPHLAFANGGFKLMVRAEDQEAAHKALEPAADQ